MMSTTDNFLLLEHMYADKLIQLQWQCHKRKAYIQYKNADAPF